MAAGKFILREWYSNVFSSVDGGSSSIVPVLGLLWDTKEDRIFCDVRIFAKTDFANIKRGLLSAGQRIFITENTK